MRVFHPNALSYHDLQLHSHYRHHEHEKRRAEYEKLNMGRSALIFSTLGGMGKAALVAYNYKRLSSLLSTKRGLQCDNGLVTLPPIIFPPPVRSDVFAGVMF